MKVQRVQLFFNIKFALVVLLFSSCDVNVLISSAFNAENKQVEEGGSELIPPTPAPDEEEVNQNPLIQALLINPPAQNSGSDFLSITVGGSEITHFRYKFGPSAQT